MIDNIKNKVNEYAPNSEVDLDREIINDWTINDIFFKSGLYGWMQVQDPESFNILVRETISYYAEKIKLEEKVKNKEDRLEEIYNDLDKARVVAEGRGAKLRPWEKDGNIKLSLFNKKFTLSLYWVNTCFDFLLKIGLILVPLLAIFKIFGINPTAPFEEPLPFIFAVFSSTALVWLTSGAIVNIIIVLSRVRFWTVNKKLALLISISVFIWAIESLIGFALIPPLIDESLRTSGGQPLGDLEKIEILFGASIYAFINVLFAIGKGTSYCYSLKHKTRYAQSKIKVSNLEEKYKKVVNEIELIKSKITEIENKLSLDYEPDYIKRKLQEISNNNTLGLDSSGKHPGEFIDRSINRVSDRVNIDNN
jgi:hypothetical protein